MTQDFAGRLVALRRSRGLSQEDLADQLSVSRQAVSKWERSEASPDTDNLIALSTLYGITLDELVRGVKLPAAAPESSNVAKDADPIDPNNPLPHGSFYDHLAEMERSRFPYPVLVAFLYLVLGFVFHLWHPGWLIFFTIPLYYLPASMRAPGKLLCNPVMIVIIYLMLGFYCNLWHPGWLIFFAIPLLHAATSEG